MNNHFITLLILVIVAFMGWSCANDDAQSKFEVQAYGEPANYTETNFQGDIVRNDTDDWRISPLYQGLASVQPIFPNPVQFGTNVTLEIDIKGAPASSSIEVGYLNQSNQWIFLQQQDLQNDFELLTFLINTRQFGSSLSQAQGIKRMLVFDGNQRLISYGDILIQ
jgi:hypothetical protein